MQFRLADIGTVMLLLGFLLSGIMNNPISFVCMFGAMISWSASVRLKDGYWMGIVSIIGWVGLAGACAMLHQTN